MKKILFYACSALALLTACNEDDDCSVAFPINAVRFDAHSGGDAILFNPEQSAFIYEASYPGGSYSSDWISYDYKIPYFLFDETNKYARKFSLKSIQIADTLGLLVTYQNDSTMYFHGKRKSCN